MAWYIVTHWDSFILNLPYGETHFFIAWYLVKHGDSFTLNLPYGET